MSLYKVSRDETQVICGENAYVQGFLASLHGIEILWLMTEFLKNEN